jgi:hypothetical protein
MRESCQWDEVMLMCITSSGVRSVFTQRLACLAPTKSLVGTVFAFALVLVPFGCAESVTPAPRLDGAIVDDSGLDGSVPRDSSTSDLGTEDAGHLPTYEVCPSWVDLCGPGESCVDITLRDAFGVTRTGATCSPPCTLDTECPPVGAQTAGCLRIAYPPAGVCVVRCDPDLPGQCAGAQECALYAGDHWCLPEP